MSTITTTTTPFNALLARLPAGLRDPSLRWRPPLLLWLSLLGVALMTFYIHLLNMQVQRGEKLREAQRAQAARPAAQQAAAQPANHLVVIPARKRAAHRAAS